MSMISRILAALTLFAVAATARGADIDADGFERILVPLAIMTHLVPRAHGTQWTGNIWLDNQADTTVGLSGIRGCNFPGCGLYQPGHVGALNNGPLTDRPEVGLVLMTNAATASRLTLSSRLWETSRAGQPRGIDLPIVREGSFFHDRKTFLAIPIDAGVRASLRIYNPWAADPGSSVVGAREVDVQILSATGQTLVSTRLYPVIVGGPIDRSDYPGFAAIHDLLAAFPQLGGHENVHVRVAPVVPDAQYYAMVAVTDNVTQTVSIITAQ